jgi:hypothetical protein
LKRGAGARIAGDRAHIGAARGGKSRLATMKLARALARGAVLACAVFALDVRAFAQAKITFDPTRDLDGFEQCMQSEFKDLYPMARYDALLGKEVSAGDLAALKKSWREETERAEKEIASLRADPLGVYLHHLHQKLAADTYFSKIAWTEDRSAAPFVFIVQKPAKDDPNSTKRVVGLYEPWAKKLATLIDAAYVKPLALKRRSEPAGYALCILASPGDYANYARLASSEFERADSRTAMAVGFEDPFDTSASQTRKRYPLLERTARLILAAHAAEGSKLSLWTSFGLPGYLAYHEGLVPDTLDQRRIDDGALALVIGALEKKDRRAVLLHPIEDLLRIVDQESLAALVRKRAAQARVKEPPWKELVQAIEAQSILWMHFLQDAEQGKYRALFMKYLHAEFTARGGLDAFETAFAGVDLATLNREFFAFVLDARERLHPTQKLDRASLEHLFEDRADMGDAEEDGDSHAEKAAPTPAPKLPAFQPSTLALQAKEIAARHGLALDTARRGDLERARKMLDELASEKPNAPEDARIARDLERLAQLVVLRDALLASYVQSGSKLSSEFRGKKFFAKVESVDKQRIVLGENKAGLSEIPLDELDPCEVARLADKKEKQGSAPLWSRAYAFIICGDSKWDKLARDPSPAARDVYQDAKSWYPELVRTGEAARAIDALSKASLPKTREEGVSAMSSIRALLAEGKGLPLVDARIVGLRSLATAAAEQAFTPDDGQAMIRGKCTPIENGRVKIVYDFKRAEEALDFTKDGAYMRRWGKTFAPAKLDVDHSSFAIEDGVFVGHGMTCYRTKLGFASPMIVRCKFRWRDVAIDDATVSSFVLGMCDDGMESCVMTTGTGLLFVYDAATGYSKQSTSSGETFNLGQSYELDLQHDGSKVTTFFDDVQKHEASSGPRKNGAVFLWVHGDYPLEIQHLEIEGALDASSTSTLKNEWIANKITELGFK